MRKRMFGSSLMLAIVASLVSVSASAAEVTLRLHQFLPAQANVPKLILDVWADKVEADSDGRIEIQRFPSMQLGGSPPELYDQAVDGIADIIWTVAGYTPGRFPHAEALELPFMMTDAESTSRAYWEFAENHMLDADYKDTHVLGLWVHGPGMIHSSEPVRTPEDLAGVKLRAPTRTTNKLFSSLGAEAIGMPVPAIPEALSKGVIDAAVIPWEVTSALKVPELVSNHTEFGGDALYTAAFVFTMNKDRYNALPDDLKKVIDDNSGAEFSAFAGKTQASSDVPSRQLAADAGNNIITLSDEEVQVWRDGAAPVVDSWIAEMDDKGFDGAALVDELRGLIDKHSN